MFVAFMLFWVVKEPVIRIFTFMSLIVTNMIVDPIVECWSIMSNNTITVEKRNKIIKWSTAATIILTVLFFVQTGGFILYPDRDYDSLHQRLNAIERKLTEHHNTLFNQDAAISQLQRYTQKQDAILLEMKSEREEFWSKLKEFKEQQENDIQSQLEMKEMIHEYQSKAIAQIERFSEQISQKQSKGRGAEEVLGVIIKEKLKGNGDDKMWEEVKKWRQSNN